MRIKAQVNQTNNGMLVNWAPNSRTCFTTSALPAPITKNTTSLALLMRGKVKVIRSGGGLGEPTMGTTHSSVMVRVGQLGKREAMWASSPIPGRG